MVVTVSRKSLVLLAVLISAWISVISGGISPGRATQGLWLAPLIYNNGGIMTLIPFKISAVVYNNDSIGHYYTLMVELEGSYYYTFNGYVNADSWQNNFLYIIPTQIGQKSVDVRLYQDSAAGGTNWINIQSVTVDVGKNPLYTAYDSLSSDVNSLKTEVSGLQDLTNRLAYALAISITIAVVIAVISLAVIARRRYHEQHDVTLYQKQ